MAYNSYLDSGYEQEALNRAAKRITNPSTPTADLRTAARPTVGSSISGLPQGRVSQQPGMGPAYTNQAVSSGVGIAANIAARNAGNTAASSGIKWNTVGGMNPYYGMGVTMATDYIGGKLKPKEELPTYGGRHGQITDQYGRRFEGAGPGIAGGAVRGAGYGTTIMPGIGTAVGAGIGALVGAATKNDPSAFKDFRVQDAISSVKDAYRLYLGREASDEEVMTHLRNQGYKPEDDQRWVGEDGLYYVLDQIADSPEGLAYAQSSGSPAAQSSAVEEVITGGKPPAEAPGPVPSGGDVAQYPGGPNFNYREVGATGTGGSLGAGGGTAGQGDISAGQPPPTPTGDWRDIQPIFAGGKPGGSPLEGFNTNRAFASEDPDSVKDAFARAAGDSGLNLSGLSKEQVQAAIEEQIVPLLRAQGIQVDQVVGDKIRVFTKERGWEWVDVVRNAGGGADQAFQWLPDAENVGMGGGGATSGAFSMGAGGGSNALRNTLANQGYSSDYSDLVLQYLLQGLGLDRAAARLER